MISPPSFASAIVPCLCFTRCLALLSGPTTNVVPPLGFMESIIHWGEAHQEHTNAPLPPSSVNMPQTHVKRHLNKGVMHRGSWEPGLTVSARHNIIALLKAYQLFGLIFNSVPVPEPTEQSNAGTRGVALR